MAEFGTRLREISNDLRTVQFNILATENPDTHQKTLRAFTTREAAAMMGITESYLRARVAAADGFPEGMLVGKSRVFRMDEINAGREILYKTTGNLRYHPGRRPGEKACVLACTNFKGGVGKSTTATHLSQYFALRGLRVLVIDLDAQASTTALFGLDPASQVGHDKNNNILSGGTTIHGWVMRAPGEERQAALEVIRKTYWPNIDLVAANAYLHKTEEELGRRISPNLRGPVADTEWFSEIRAFIDFVADGAVDPEGRGYDIILLDCRPDINWLSFNAFSASDGLIIPVLATNMDVQSVTEFLGFLADTESRLKRLFGTQEWRGWSFIRVLVNRFVGTNRSQVEIMDNLNFRLPDIMIRSPMVETTTLGSAANTKWTLYEYLPPKSEDRSYKRAITAMDNVGQVIESEVLSFWGRGEPITQNYDVAAE